MKKRNSKLTFYEALDKKKKKINVFEESCQPWNHESDTYIQITGKEEAKEEILQFILSDFKRRAGQLRDLVKNVTHETRESQNAEFLEKLIKEYSGKDKWIYDYKEGLDIYKNGIET